ncbi:MAG TPA: nucleoside deaminase [Chitinophagales bacterium]|nr:nucleoside deaminase [Chitinophagales bacterium]
MDKFMKRAVQLALQNVNKGGQPFGAVLVHQDTIIAEGINEMHQKHDVSSHAELNAIRAAQAQLQTSDLSDFVMYASGYPCPMCLASMYFVGIKKIYYCASLEELKQIGLKLSAEIYKDLTKNSTERDIVMKQLPITGDTENPLKLWAKK